METPRSPRRRSEDFHDHDCAGAVVMIDGLCLVLRRANRDEWVFPKGHIEHGELTEVAAVREAREGSGLEVSLTR
jgi:8-oxo-dGTP pyrophosphatase MutT (NUDIX family)